MTIRMRNIFYLGYYGNMENIRTVSPAGKTMMDYIINSLERIDNDFTVISPAQATTNINRKEIITDNKRIIFLRSYSSNLFILRIINRFRRKFNLYNELNKLLSDGDTLIVYHSLAYIDILKKIRRKKKINLILQVCEIYADVLEDKKERVKEIKWIETADKYIFSTERLEQILNINKKEYAICMGMYKYNDIVHDSIFNDDLIHVVYAGTFDLRKGGGQAAVTAAEYLNDKYHLHILGFGSEEQILEIKDLIKIVSEKSQCKLSYDGLKIGNDYINFIKSCHIGLSTQNPNATFNETSFPSKILSYMSNGLRVVSIKIPVIENSRVGKYLTYYERQTPEEIANAIMSVNINDDYSARKIIEELDSSFFVQLKKLLREDI